MRGRVWLVLGAVLAATAVAMGAYHAHGLEKWLVAQALSPRQIDHQMANTATAVRYQMYHALGLLLIGVMLAQRPSRLLHAAAVFLLTGVVGFSGGLYLIVFSGTPFHWAIVPSGGLMFIVGWLLVALGAVWPAGTGNTGTGQS